MPRNARTLPWTAILPIGLIAAAVGAVLWFDITEGGGAAPDGYIGEIGTPVRSAYIEPTPLPPGAQATIAARPTVVVRPGAATASGTPDERDLRRRGDLLILLDAATRLKEQDGSYPDTKNNVQTLCSYQEQDVGCKLKEVVDGDLPIDPLGDGIRNGYWYSSDGDNVRFYAALEVDVPDTDQCDTSDAELSKRANLICIEGS